MPANEVLVLVKGASVKFTKRVAIEAIDLTLRRGEITSLIGPNGAGKSTLLRLILGIIEPSSGYVERTPGLRIGYVPQKLQIDPTLPITVSRFLALSSSKDIQGRKYVLQEVGAAHLADRALQELSGGELQRVLLARALLRDPDLLVLDEPGQGVDINGQAELFQMIDHVRRQHGCAVLLVSHDLHLVMAATDHVICLNHHICCRGRPETVSEHPEYQALFGKPVAAAVAVYQHHHDHHHDLEGRVIHISNGQSP